jgi:hypothetical protein
MFRNLKRLLKGALERLPGTKKKYLYRVQGMIAFEFQRKPGVITAPELQRMIELEDEKFPWDKYEVERTTPKISFKLIENNWSIPTCEWQFTICHNNGELSWVQIATYERYLRRIAHAIASNKPKGISVVRSDIIIKRSNRFTIPCPNK